MRLTSLYPIQVPSCEGLCVAQSSVSVAHPECANRRWPPGEEDAQPVTTIPVQSQIDSSSVKHKFVAIIHTSDWGWNNWNIHPPNHSSITVSQLDFPSCFPHGHGIELRRSTWGLLLLTTSTWDVELISTGSQSAGKIFALQLCTYFSKQTVFAILHLQVFLLNNTPLGWWSTYWHIFANRGWAKRPNGSCLGIPFQWFERRTEEVHMRWFI